MRAGPTDVMQGALQAGARPEPDDAEPLDHAEIQVTDGRRRRWRLALLGLAVLLATGAGLAWHWLGATAAPPAFTTATVRVGSIEDSVSALGNIQPRDYVDVGTQVSGQLKLIHVKIGDRVKAQDLLAEIDPTVYRARVDVNRAQLDNLRAQLDERQARLKLARQVLQRQQNLRRANATSEEALEQAQAEVAAGTAQIAALGAQIGQTESQLRADNANLGYTRIHAPMAGTIVSITARKGQTLNANQSAPIILRVADLAVMTVKTQVSEADIGRLRLGQSVYFSTLGDPDRRYTGTLQQILPTPEVVNNVVLYDALFDVPNPEGTLMTQMTAQVFFVVARADNVLTVPASALRAGGQQGQGDGGTSVLVVAPDGAVEKRQVEIGVATRTEVEIRSGLKEGETVVTGPAPAATSEDAGRRFSPRPRLG
jgi:macrolide-specific efflux system membrane fusion protein